MKVISSNSISRRTPTVLAMYDALAKAAMGFDGRDAVANNLAGSNPLPRTPESSALRSEGPLPGQTIN